MEEMEYLYELFESMPRCGPGNDETTAKAFEMITDLPENPVVLDLGCGPGVQTLELARLTGSRIIALDNHQPFLDEMTRRAYASGLSAYIEPIKMDMFQMDFKDNTFDLIWSEGALYNMGFQKGLRKCNKLLKRGGSMAVSELVLFSEDTPAEVMIYLESEYPDIKDIKGNLRLIKTEGFEVLSHFSLGSEAWLDNFYIPMEKELDHMENKYRENEVASVFLSQMRQEIEMYRQYGDFFGYEFFIMKKVSL